MTASRGHDDAGTAGRILDVAERLVQVRGFNGFSYADIAAELHLTKAALHYHFAGKADLGAALIARYADRFTQALAEVDAGADARADGASAKLVGYADLYLQVLRARKMCLCGMLAAEYQTLPPPMQDAVIGFFDHNETWLEGVLEQGRRDGSLQFAGSARDTARMIVGGLEGAMLVARPYGDIARFQAAAANLLAGLAPAGHGDGRGTPAPAPQPNTTVRGPASTTRSSA
ncbi:MAG TPA: TetR/AcrR family transcriptional regulator [Streptosporangiaceae bacterium]|nr:TetR/AcrR family transcriptional regulator [Streptosporangiaceae bacterium]